MTTKKLLQAILVLATAVIAIFLIPTGQHVTNAPGGSISAQTDDEGELYICPMHPSVRSKSPSSCPVCGMSLVQQTGPAGDKPHPTADLGDVSISPEKQVLANVATSRAENMNLTETITAVGIIQSAEDNLRTITARIGGRVEKLFLTYTGQFVPQGAPVAALYSPDAISAQQEYLLAKRASVTTSQPGTNSFLEESREKLLRLGFTSGQISRLDREMTIEDPVMVYTAVGGTVTGRNIVLQQYVSPGDGLYEIVDLSKVWIVLQVYEREMARVKLGQRVQLTSEAYPGKYLDGAVEFISPVLDPTTRTVDVRASVENRNGSLKPGMFITGSIKIPIPRGLTVPETAVMTTGGRQVVWVKRGEGIFTPKSVSLGVRTEGYYQVLNGLEEGDVVASSGGYLIDSEGQLQFPTGDTGRSETDDGVHRH